MNDLESRFSGNLLEPLLFDDWGAAGKFIRDQRCAFCLGCLVPQFAPDHKYTVECPEHGAIYGHNHIHRADAERVVDGQRTGAFEIRSNL